MNCIKNIEKLFSKLEKLEIDTDEIVIKVLNQANNRVKKEAKLLCPVEGTEELRSSINSRIESGEKGRMVGIVFTKDENAPYVELGTRPKGKANKPAVAKPFLYPAFKQTQFKISQDFRDALYNYIRGLK